MPHTQGEDHWNGEYFKIIMTGVFSFEKNTAEQ